MTEVVPAIIPISKTQLEDEISIVSNFATLVQIDISDGVFTKTRTWPYNGADKDYFNDLKLQNIGWPKWDKINYEVHLMINSPENVILDWINTGVESVIAHIESTNDFEKLISICRENETKIGLAIKPSTSLERASPFIENVDFVQVMGSDNLGEHGVELEESALELIKTLKEKYPSIIIAVDIGVNEDTKEELFSLGVSKLVSGSAILESGDPHGAYNNLSA